MTYNYGMEADAQVKSCLDTKKCAVLSGGYELLHASDSPQDREIADFYEEALREMEGTVTDLLFEVMDALSRGHSIAEINWKWIEGGKWDGKVGIKSIKPKDPGSSCSGWTPSPIWKGGGQG